MTNSLFSSRCDFRFSFEIAKKKIMYIFLFAQKRRAYFTSSKVDDNKSQISARSSDSLKTSRRCRHFATEKKRSTERSSTLMNPELVALCTASQRRRHMKRQRQPNKVSIIHDSSQTLLFCSPKTMNWH